MAVRKTADGEVTPPRARSRRGEPGGSPPGDRNEILLVGRLAGEPTERELPTGDRLLSWRVVVARDGGAQVARGIAERSRQRVDTIDCSTVRKQVARAVARWSPGDHIEVTGALRRRFWRNAQGLSSRYEVDVVAARRA